MLTASEEVRSLIFAPLVYSQVPYEVLMSYTDNANIQLLSLTSKPLKMVWFYAPSYKLPYNGNLVILRMLHVKKRGVLTIPAT